MHTNQSLTLPSHPATETCFCNGCSLGSTFFHSTYLHVPASHSLLWYMYDQNTNSDTQSPSGLQCWTHSLLPGAPNLPGCECARFSFISLLILVTLATLPSQTAIFACSVLLTFLFLATWQFPHTLAGHAMCVDALWPHAFTLILLGLYKVYFS